MSEPRSQVACGEPVVLHTNLYCHPYDFLGLDMTLEECAQAAAQHGGCYQNDTTRIISWTTAYNSTCRCARDDCSFHYDSHPHTTYEIQVCPAPTTAPTFSFPSTSPTFSPPSTSPTSSTPSTSPSTSLPSTAPSQPPSRTPTVQPSHLPSLVPSFFPSTLPTPSRDSQVEKVWYRDFVNVYCPLHEDEARLCYDRVSPPIIRNCDSGFTEKCEFWFTISNVKFVEQGLCISHGASADVCAEMGMAVGYTFKGSACVGVDYGQDDCATHGSKGTKTEKVRYFVDPGFKICIVNVGVGCGDGADFQGHKYVSMVPSNSECPLLEEISDLPDCLVNIQDEKEDEHCHMIPEDSECFIVENDDKRSARLLCEGHCNTNALTETLDSILSFAQKRVNKIVPVSEVLKLLPWQSNNNNDDLVLLPGDWDLDGCDFDADLTLHYDHHPVEGWIDKSGYNILTNTYHPGQAVTYCVWQSTPRNEYSGANMLNSTLSLLLVFVVLCLFHL